MARSAVASVSTPGVLVTSTPRSRAGGHVDVVEPDRDVGDHLEPRRRTQEAGIDDVGEERHGGVRGRQLLVPDLARDRLVALQAQTWPASRSRDRPTSGIRPRTAIRAGCSVVTIHLRTAAPAPWAGRGRHGAGGRIPQATGQRQARRVPGLRPVADHTRESVRSHRMPALSDMRCSTAEPSDGGCTPCAPPGPSSLLSGISWPQRHAALGAGEVVAGLAVADAQGEDDIPVRATVASPTRLDRQLDAP